jgi:hypothetical protein
MKPKFNFIPERQLKKPAAESAFKVNIYVTGTLVFTKDVVEIYDLDQKFVRMYGDATKKVIGWSVIQGGNIEEMDDLRQLKKNVNGMITVSIKKLLESIGWAPEGTTSGLEVKKYKSPLHAEDIFYVELPAKSKQD